MKRLILTNLSGGITQNVDIEVVPSVYLLSQLHQASLLWRHTYSFPNHGQVRVRYLLGLETVRLSIRDYVLTVPGSKVRA